MNTIQYNGIGQNGINKMERTEWYGQNGSNFFSIDYDSSEFNTCLVANSHK